MLLGDGSEEMGWRKAEEEAAEHREHRGGGSSVLEKEKKWGMCFFFTHLSLKTHSCSVLVTVSENHLRTSPFFLTLSLLFFIQCSSILHGFCKTKHGNWLDLRGKDGFGREKDGFVGFESEEEREERFRGGVAMAYGEKRRRNKVKDLWVCEDLRWGNDCIGEREREIGLWVCQFLLLSFFLFFFITMSCLQVDIFFSIDSVFILVDYFHIDWLFWCNMLELIY